MNQCDGCIRGLPLNDAGHHADKNGHPVMACTKDRYAAAIRQRAEELTKEQK